MQFFELATKRYCCTWRLLGSLLLLFVAFLSLLFFRSFLHWKYFVWLYFLLAGWKCWSKVLCLDAKHSFEPNKEIAVFWKIWMMVLRHAQTYGYTCILYGEKKESNVIPKLLRNNNYFLKYLKQPNCKNKICFGKKFSLWFS